MIHKSKYKAQYDDPRWQKRRLDILNLRGWKCEHCESEVKTLNVHHAYYVPQREVWRYPNWALKCLCNECHKSVHEENPGVTPWEHVFSELFKGCDPSEQDDVIDLAFELSRWNVTFNAKMGALLSFIHCERKILQQKEESCPSA